MHVIDLVVPEERTLARALALRDRGRHPRTLPALRRVLEAMLVPDVEQQFPLRFGPIALWQMVYVRGTPREGACASV